MTSYLRSGLVDQGALPVPGSPTELVLRLFSRGEAFDSDGFVEFFTEACIYQFGNLPICYDKPTMLESSRWFFRNVTAVYHDIKSIWEINECVMVEMDVWYWRLDGSQVVLPCSDIFRVEGSKFSELRIFMDVAPVFEPKPVPADASVWFVGPGSRLPESGLMRTFFAEHPEGRRRVASGYAPKWSIANPPHWAIASTPALPTTARSGGLGGYARQNNRKGQPMSDDVERGGIWDSQTWNEISRAVLEDVGRVRVAQKVFPSELRLSQDSVQSDTLTTVPAPPGEASPIMIREGMTVPFFEIYAKFALTTSQINNEAELRSAYTLAQLTSRKLALAEDLILFQGIGATLPSGVAVNNLRPEWNGLLNLDGMLDPIVVGQTPNGGYGENTFRAVSEGISALIAAGHPGPYALILETRVFADTFAPLGTNTLVATSDRISPLVDGRFFGTGTLPPATGLLVSLGGSPTTIFVGRDADVVYNHNDPFGNHRFRVFERVQVVNREPAALLRLTFAGARSKRG